VLSLRLCLPWNGILVDIDDNTIRDFVCYDAGEAGAPGSVCEDSQIRMCVSVLI
jgi:hypothetical protein